MNDDVVIKVEGVSKKYCRTIKHTMLYGATDLARSFLGMNQKTESLRDGEFWALDNINFELKKGETLGIIGVNGSGKSTLLKMLNGIFMPDRGKIEINGKVGALIEVGAGFHPMLTGRENIFINGAILGMTKDEIDRKFDEIIDFADIGEFIDSPVKHYSSGMYVRLGFAIAVHCEPGILLIDEVLSVGDAGFRLKCAKVIESWHDRSVILVSHNLNQIKSVCTKALLINKGKMCGIGAVEDILKLYEQVINKNNMNVAGVKYSVLALDEEAGDVNILSVSPKGQASPTQIVGYKMGQDIPFEIRLHAKRPCEGLYLSIGFLDQNHKVVGATTSIHGGTWNIPDGNTIVRGIIKTPSINPGLYYLGSRLGIKQTYAGLNEKISSAPLEIIRSDEERYEPLGGYLSIDARWQNPVLLSSFENGQRKSQVSSGKILLVVPNRGWAFENICRHFQEYLLNEGWEADIFFLNENGTVDYDSYDFIYAPVFSAKSAEVEELISECNGRLLLGSYSHKWVDWPEKDIVKRVSAAKWLIVPSKKLSDLFSPYTDKICQVHDAVDPRQFYYTSYPDTSELVAIWSGIRNVNWKRFYEIVKPACIKAGVRLLVGEGLTRDELNVLYNKSHIVLIASENMEGGPNMLLEAGATARPVIATDCGMVPEVVTNGDNGFIVDGNVDAFVDKLTWAKTNIDKIKEMGEKHREVVLSQYTFDHASSLFRALLSRIKK